MLEGVLLIFKLFLNQFFYARGLPNTDFSLFQNNLASPFTVESLQKKKN